MEVPRTKRKEISTWAKEKALEDACKEGVDLSGIPDKEVLGHPSWLQERIWHYEKMAYLKIHNREHRRSW